MTSRLHLVKVILRKELIDLLRDRRTIFMMVVVPILLYPLLLIVVMQLAIFQAGRLEEKVSHIVIINGNAAPELLDGFQASAHLESVDSLNWRDRIREGEIDAAIEFAPGFEAEIQSALQPPVTIYYNSSREFSRRTMARLEEPLEGYRNRIIEQRIQALSADTSLLTPFAQTETDLASDEQQQGELIGNLLGYILVFMVLTGAFYAAIELTAGEKERGTLETLLVSPARRVDIVYGKFLATVTASVITAFLNLISLGLTAVYAFHVLGKAAAGLSGIAINPFSLLLVFLIVIPLAVLFSGVCLAIAVTARNYKEGQSALTPVLIMVMLPAVIGMLPGIELTPGLALVPITNVMLLTTEFMRGNYLFWETLITILTTSIFAGLSLWWVTGQFHQESVVFRHADDIKWSLLSRRPSAVATPTPSAASALLTAMILLIVLTLLGSFAPEWNVIRSIVSVQAVILLPVIFILYRGNHNVRASLALRRPHPLVWIAAVIVALSGWLVTVEAAALQHLFLPFPDDLLEQFRDLFVALNTMPLFTALLLIAVLPGVCEELLCRGFMLRAFRPRLGNIGAVILVAIIFALLHMNPYRYLPTFILGILLGLISLWSGSIYPAMLMHFMNNAISYFVEKNVEWLEESISWLAGDADLLPPWMVVTALLILAAALRWLWKIGQGQAARDVVETSPDYFTAAPTSGELSPDRSSVS